MHTHDPTRWQHDHVFNQDHVRTGEKRTLIIALITALMMVVEIAAGLMYGSMALLADGLHMASHAAALGIAFPGERIGHSPAMHLTIGLFVPPSRRTSSTSQLFTGSTTTTYSRLHEFSGPTAGASGTIRD